MLRNREIPVSAMVEGIIGCKWSLQVLAKVREGVCRPGELVRSCPGLSTKVLNQRLRKMQRFGILDRIVHPVVPPHVEYKLTPFGERFTSVLDAVASLQAELDDGEFKA